MLIIPLPVDPRFIRNLKNTTDAVTLTALLQMWDSADSEVFEKQRFAQFKADKLQEVTGLSKGKLWRSLQSLASQGLITLTKPGGHRLGTFWRPLLDDIEAAKRAELTYQQRRFRA